MITLNDMADQGMLDDARRLSLEVYQVSKAIQANRRRRRLVITGLIALNLPNARSFGGCELDPARRIAGP